MQTPNVKKKKVKTTKRDGDRDKTRATGNPLDGKCHGAKICSPVNPAAGTREGSKFFLLDQQLAFTLDSSQAVSRVANHGVNNNVTRKRYERVDVWIDSGVFLLDMQAN